MADAIPLPYGSNGESKYNPGAKRSEAQRADDIRVAADLKRRGKSLKDIHVVISERNPAITLSKEAVRLDLLAAEKLWATEYLKPIRTAKAIELSRLEAVFEEAWEEYQRSKRDAREATRTTEGAKEATGDSSVTKTVQKVITREGNPQFLAIVLKTLEQISKILGLDAPVKIEGEIVDGGDAVKAKMQERFMLAQRIHIEKQLEKEGWKKPEPKQLTGTTSAPTGSVNGDTADQGNGGDNGTSAEKKL